MGLELTLVTPRKKIVTDLPVKNVKVPGFRGELDILEGHAALVTTLSTGVLEYKEFGTEKVGHAAISWGYVEVIDDKVTILAETAETAEEIDLKRANIALEGARERMKNTQDLLREQRKFERAQARIEAAQTRKH